MDKVCKHLQALGGCPSSSSVFIEHLLGTGLHRQGQGSNKTLEGQEGPRGVPDACPDG